MKIPVHVLSGFLGAGKTTAIKDVLSRRADRERIAVVVNEFGTLGVDGALLSDCASCILREIPGGCVCCTAMADLEASLEEVSDLVAPTRFVLEPTGLARPSELVDLLRGPRWANRFDVRPVITILDPQQDVAGEYARSGVFRDQIDTGDVLVVNRCDLASEEEILRVEEFARALVPAKLLVVRASHGVLPDAIWDLERPAASAETTLLAASASHPHPHGDFLEGHQGRGIGYPPDRVFDADRLLAALEVLRTGTLTKGRVARAKGLFHTTAGWRLHEIAGGRLSTEATSWRRDSRVDVILKDPETGEFGDFFEWERVLTDSLVPADAPLLMLEDGAGAVRAYDPRGFEALSHSLSKEIFSSSSLSSSNSPPSAFRLADVMALAGIAREADWMWLVMDSGLFGVGGPRRVLENGVVFPFDGAFRYVLSDEAARGAEDEVDACRDLTNVCGVRLGDAPGGAEGAPP
ncbi:MAG: GTP-binding protein [Thermoanaerobaculia bacterium]|nr:GTP-binding protein [Thermoanaerobaculia bacterium]